MWEGVRDRTELQHTDPHSFGYHSLSFPFSWAAQSGAWRPSLSGTWSSFQHLLSNCNCSIGGLKAPSAGCWFFLPHLISNWLTSCLHPDYIIVCRPPSSCERHKSHSIQPVHGQGHILIFLDRMYLLFTQVHFLLWQHGRVGGRRSICNKNNSFFSFFPPPFIIFDCWIPYSSED